MDWEVESERPSGAAPAGGGWEVASEKPSRSVGRQIWEGVNTGVNWLGSRAVDAAAGLAGVATQPMEPIKRMAAMVGAPEEVNRLLKYAYPDSATAKEMFYSETGAPEVNSPGWPGKIVDAGVSAAMTGPLFAGGAIRNAVAGFGGGAASEIGGQLTKGSRYEPAVRAVAGAAGGVVSAMGANAVREAARPFTRAGQRQMAGEVYFNDLASDPKAARAALESAPGEMVPGSRPTTAKLTNDPGLLATENVLAGGAGRGGEFVLRAADNAAARMSQIEGVQGGAGPQAAADYFRQAIQARRGQIDEATRAAADRVQAALDNLPPGATAQQAGEAIRTALQQRVDILKTVRSDATSPLYDDARASTADVTPTGALRTLNDEGATAVGGAASRVDAATKYLTRPDGTPKNTVAELDAAFKQLGDDIATARSTGQNNQVRILTEAKAQVEAAMRGEPMYGAARGMYEGLSRPLDRFQSPQAPNIERTLSRDPRAGIYTMADDVVPQQFLRQGAQGAATMREFAAAGPNAIQTMKGHIAEQVRALPPMQVEGWLRRHAPALDALDPQYAQQLRDIAVSQQGAARVTQTATEAGRALDRSPAARFTGADPDKAVSQVFGAPDARARMTALVQEAVKDRTGQAIGSLRRGIVEDVINTMRTTATDARGNPGQSNAALQRWWQNNAETARVALTPQQFEKLAAVVKDSAMDARSASRVSGSDTMRNLETDRIITTRIATAVLGRGAANSPLVQSLMRPLGMIYRVPEQRVRESLTDIALNPVDARALMPTANRMESGAFTKSTLGAGVLAPLPAINQPRERRRDRPR